MTELSSNKVFEVPEINNQPENNISEFSQKILDLFNGRALKAIESWTIDPRNLWNILKDLVNNESILFQDVLPILMKAEKIDAMHLWETLKIAVRDQSCTFQDIFPILMKAEKIEANHLGEILKLTINQKKRWDTLDLSLINKLSLWEDFILNGTHKKYMRELWMQ